MTLGPEWFVVEQRGFDTSGRPLRNTRYMWAIWDALREHPVIKPFAWKLVMVQSGFMVQGAAASDGFHALGGCCDIRTWNLLTSEIDKVVWVGRSAFALGAYRRDTSWAHGGMAEHAHWSQGGDRPQSSGSAISWASYLDGRAGLVSVSRDYERRPSPLVLTPPSSIFQEELTMDTDVRNAFDHLNDRLTTIKADLRADIDQVANAETARAIAERRRDRDAAAKAKAVATRMIGKLGGMQDQLGAIQRALAAGDTDKANTLLAAASTFVETGLAGDPDVDGVDSPAVRSDR